MGNTTIIKKQGHIIMKQNIRKLQKQNRKVGIFGVSYLDDKLRGILLGDLIIIGARSGAGKSTIANMIAENNKNKGNKVALFSLENFDGDIFIEKSYYKYKELSKDYELSLRDYASGEFNINNDLLDEAEKYANEQLQDITIISRQKDFGTEKLCKEIIKQSQEGCELIILDHLDYVSRDVDENENKHIIHLMKELREVQEVFKVAIVAISHLRKPYNSLNAPKIPSYDEFYGSASKVKEATAVVMLAPDDDTNMCADKNEVRATWCCVRKLRMGGFDNRAARMFFNTKTGKYKDEYQILKVNYSGSQVEAIT